MHLENIESSELSVKTHVIDSQMLIKKIFIDLINEALR